MRATTRGRDPGRRRGGREPTCSLAHACYLRGGAIPPPQFTSRLLSHHILLCPLAFSPLASSVLTSLPLVFAILLCALLQRYITTDHAAWDCFMCAQLSQRRTACRARASQSEGRAKVEAGHDPSWYGCSAGLVHHRGRYNGESMRRVSRMLMLRRQRRQGRIPSGTVRCMIRCDVPCRCIMHGVGASQGALHRWGSGMEGRVSVQKGRADGEGAAPDSHLRRGFRSCLTGCLIRCTVGLVHHRGQYRGQYRGPHVRGL